MAMDSNNYMRKLCNTSARTDHVPATDQMAAK